MMNGPSKKEMYVIRVHLGRSRCASQLKHNTFESIPSALRPFDEPIMVWRLDSC